MRPVVAIVDGIVGIEGDGPLFGTGVPHGVLAAGADPVAVDSTCARLMGFDPQKVGYLWLAGWAGVGQVDRVETRGATVAQLQRRYQEPPGSTLRG